MADHGKYICFFAHYNAGQGVSEYVLYYLKSLFDLNIRIVFISNSKIGEKQRPDLLRYIRPSDLHERENKGNDFGAWSWAFCKNLANTEYEFLLLTNDSIYGPLTEIGNLLHHMEKGDYDWWGLTASNQGDLHLQSYFLCFRKHVVNASAFRKIFEKDFDNKSKEDIIKDGEIALSTQLMKTEFKWGVFSDCGKTDIRDNGLSSNPTHHSWFKLIKEHEFPFIKRELLLKNPDNIESVGDIFQWISTHTHYPSFLLRNDVIEQTNMVGRNTKSDVSNISIAALCHIYYPFRAIPFLQELQYLKNVGAEFFFNLSAELAASSDFVEILKNAYPGAIIISAPEKGRDIGGKLALLDILYKLKKEPDIIFVGHDKFSSHSPDGNSWRSKLLRIIQPGSFEESISFFTNDSQIGMVGAKEFIRTESGFGNLNIPDNNRSIIQEMIEKFRLNEGPEEYVAGSIFLVRGDIMKDFFSKYRALDRRTELENGNSSDTFRGTYTHAWERLFGRLVISAGKRIIGV